MVDVEDILSTDRLDEASNESGRVFLRHRIELITCPSEEVEIQSVACRRQWVRSRFTALRELRQLVSKFTGKGSSIILA